MTERRRKQLESFSKFLNRNIDRRVPYFSELSKVQDELVTVNLRSQTTGEWAGWNEGWTR